MERITKKAIDYNRRYDAATASDLYDVYKAPSYNKVRAFMRCVERMHEAGGRHMRILGATCHFFTIGYEYVDDKTGEMRLAVETGQSFYDFPRLG